MSLEKRNNFIVGLLVLMTQMAGSFSALGRVPEEYESTGGHSLAFGGSVATATGGISAVRSNPALLSLEKEYSMNGSYHWPAAGRDFYQVGAVDGTTSSVAAGFSMTGSLNDYQGISNPPGEDPSYSVSQDTPVIRRMALGFALPVGKIFFGVGGGYIEAKAPAETIRDGSDERVKGFTLSGGLAANILQNLRVGLSAENLANKKIQFAAPTFYRAGVSYFYTDLVSVNFDFRRREAVSEYEGQAPSLALRGEDTSASIANEDLYNLSTSVKVYDLLRFILSAGHVRSGSLSSHEQVGGGLALTNKKFNFSYQLIRPDIAENEFHHAVSLGVNVAM